MDKQATVSRSSPNKIVKINFYLIKQRELSLKYLSRSLEVRLFLLLLRTKTGAEEAPAEEEDEELTASGGELEPEDEVVDPVDDRLLAR
jgi:hypothetical protein